MVLSSASLSKRGKVMDKNEIKKKIDKLSDSLIPQYGRGAGSTEAVLTIYIGMDSEKLMKELLNEAFSTSFSTKPIVLEMSVESLLAEQMYYQERLIAVIENSDGRSFDLRKLRVIFVAMMDDPVFTDNSFESAEYIKQSFLTLSRMGIELQKIAFYGLFHAKKVMSHDYKNAFNFVKAGKELWNNIFHMEVPLNVRSLKAYADLIAVHCIANQYNMSQIEDRDEYAWQSIHLHCLKVPEFLITRILHTIYTSQINGKRIDQQELESRVLNALNDAYNRIFGDELSGCEWYIPLNYREDIPDRPARGFSILGRQKQTVTEYTFAEIAKDLSSLEKLASLAFEDKILEKKEYDRIIESIIINAKEIDDNLGSVSTSIDQVLKTIEENYLEQKKRASNHNHYTERKQDIDEVLSLNFAKEKERAILDKKIDIIEVLRNQLRSTETIGRVIGYIVKRNNELLEILKDLSINDYGGTLVEVHASGIPKFPVKQSIDEVLEQLDQQWLIRFIKDKNVVMTQMRAFLTREIASLDNKHRLGEIIAGYTQLEPITTVMLMPPELGANTDYQRILNQSGCMEIRTDAIFRDSTFYMLSSRLYASEKNISRYHRGND